MPIGLPSPVAQQCVIQEDSGAGVLSLSAVISSHERKAEEGLMHYAAEQPCDVCIHRVWKKDATLFFAITLPNPNRYSKFFCRHTQQ